MTADTGRPVAHAPRPRTAGAAALISPLAAAGRADEVVERISQAIQLGLFTDGEQLPPEIEFAGQLGVSVMTLREALSALRHDGLVETRRGRNGGTFVHRPASPAPDMLRARLRGMTVTTLRDLADEQLAVSGTAARLAAARAPAGSVRRLLALVDQLERAAELGARIRADCRFHIEVALASQSERLTRLEVGLQAQLTDLLWLPDEPGPGHLDPVPGREAAVPGRDGGPGRDGAPGGDGGGLDPAAVAAEHHAIATAIAAEDGDQARLLAERHVQRNLRRLTALRLADGPRATAPSPRRPRPARTAAGR